MAALQMCLRDLHGDHLARLQFGAVVAVSQVAVLIDMPTVAMHQLALRKTQTVTLDCPSNHTQSTRLDQQST